MTSGIVDLRSSLDSLLREHMQSCSREHPSVCSQDFLDRFRALAERIQYRDWKPIISIRGTMPYLQVRAIMEDSIASGVMLENNTRPVPLCEEMSDGFIIDMIFESIKEFELHEAAERFRVDGQPVFYPHAPNGQPLWGVRSMRLMEAASIDSPQTASPVANTE